MELFIALVVILQTFSISLGVGSSTLAIVNFFVAIADGKIDPTERKMMGIVYVVLRVAMVAIFVTTILLVANDLSKNGFLTTFDYAELIPLFVLFTNASLMTLKIMPSTFGPSIQAGSWYTLGTLAGLEIVGFTEFQLMHFILAYITWIVLATGITNGIMAIMREKFEQSKKTA